MQTEELQHDQEQKTGARPADQKEILPLLSQTYGS
jgi:hypothetical protein